MLMTKSVNCPSDCESIASSCNFHREIQQLSAPQGAYLRRGCLSRATGKMRPTRFNRSFCSKLDSRTSESRRDRREDYCEAPLMVGLMRGVQSASSLLVRMVGVYRCSGLIGLAGRGTRDGASWA